MSQTVDTYIAGFPKASQEVLRTLRALFLELVPDAVEQMSYNIPAYKLHGRVFLYFAAFPHHVSIYPRTRGIEERLGDVLTPYAKGKGTMQFSLALPMPYEVIRQILLARKQEMNLVYAKRAK
ncbi:hypothetical protein COW46_01745 [Candidatus Gracilibacteria bacterium CG17_big_fil_post_rev_8_21_14_2_50_48_13]|nr:MAG: hypothetical protein COW46_01745 [Candidatus Gracilibacteria bacterium CG17_big_fil_post_rev_8_21_14_2_50_48_13]